MAATAFFVWPSAVLTYPLVVAELLVFLREEYSIEKSGASTFRSVVAFAVGGLVTTSLLLIPIWRQLKTVFNDIEPILRASQSPYRFSLQVKNLLDSFKYSQLLPVGVLMSFIWGRGRLIAWMALLVFVYILSTRVYLNRLIYLLPYAIGLIGEVYRMPLTLVASAKTRRLITNVGLSLLMVGSVSLSLFVRPAIALSQKSERDSTILFRLGHELIGNGPHLVYLGDCDFYFPGRSLGWHMLHEYDEDRTDLSQLLLRADHAIFRMGKVGYELAAQLSTAGLYLQKEVDDRPHQMDTNHQFRLGTQGYGSYLLYSRRVAIKGH